MDDIRIELAHRRMTMRGETNIKLQDFILDKLVNWPGERRRMSELVLHIRDDASSNFPTTPHDAQKIFETLGFSIVREGRTVYVTV